MAKNSAFKMQLSSRVNGLPRGLVQTHATPLAEL